MRTLSEQLFETYCDRLGIRWRRIVEGRSRTPDYELFLPRRKVIVEVKETTPNDEEKRAAQELKEKGFAVGSLTPGDRVRKLITKAAPQIKARTRGRLPGVLIVFDNGIVARHIDPYQIRVAMYGFDQLVIGVPNNLRESPYLIGRKSGGKRKMTEQHNTSLSALGALFCPAKDSVELTLYHNRFAARPLDRSLFGRYRTQQYELGVVADGEIAQWVECDPERPNNTAEPDARKSGARGSL